MPETFGGGIPFAPRDGRPLGLGRFTVHGGDTVTHGPFPGGGTAVLTSMDMVSYGAGGSGFALFAIVNGGATTFMAINIGSDTDAFSWRGMIPLINSDTWRCINDSGQSLDIILSGMWVPTEYFAV